MRKNNRRTDDEGKVVGNLKLICSVESIRNASMVLVECLICGYQKRIRRTDYYKSKGTCRNCQAIAKKQKRITAVKNKQKTGKLKNGMTYSAMKRDSWAASCSICGISEWNGKNLSMDVDHIIPISRGGTDSYSNLQYLCPNCHRQKTELDIKDKKEKGKFVVCGIFPHSI